MSDTRTRNSGSGGGNLQTPRVYDTPDEAPKVYDTPDEESSSQAPKEPVREPIGDRAVTPPVAPAIHTRPAVSTSTQPTLGDLFKGLSADLSTLVRQEIDLAKAEVQENAKKAMRGGIIIAIGGLLAYAGLILVLIAISIALGMALGNFWLSTGIVGLIVLIIAAILYSTGKSQLDEVEVTPRRTVESLEQDVEMAKEKLS